MYQCSINQKFSNIQLSTMIHLSYLNLGIQEGFCFCFVCLFLCLLGSLFVCLLVCLFYKLWPCRATKTLRKLHSLLNFHLLYIDFGFLQFFVVERSLKDRVLAHLCRLVRQINVMKRSVTRIHAPIPAPMIRGSWLAPNSDSKANKQAKHTVIDPYDIYDERLRQTEFVRLFTEWKWHTLRFSILHSHNTFVFLRS